MISLKRFMHTISLLAFRPFRHKRHEELSARFIHNELLGVVVLSGLRMVFDGFALGMFDGFLLGMMLAVMAMVLRAMLFARARLI